MKFVGDFYVIIFRETNEGVHKMTSTVKQVDSGSKADIVQSVLKASFDFKDSKIHPQAVENLKRYLKHKNAKSK